MTDLTTHPIISYSQHNVVPGHCCSLLWDLRELPHCARHVEYLDKVIPPSVLDQHATTPPTVFLKITCGMFPEDWPAVQAQRLEGVTIGDVLLAIHTFLHHRISKEEWEQLSQKQQERISAIYEARCRLSEDRDACRENGVLRIDCLMHHTWFAGLSPSLEDDSTCILSLRRPQ